MTRRGRRFTLYGCCIGVGAALLFAGFGITVPPDPGTRLSGAQMLGGLGDYDRALEICDQVIAEHPDNLDAYVYRATFLARAGRHGEAVAAYDDALERVHSGESVHRRLRADRASVLLAAGRLQDFQYARDALARGGVDVSVHVLDGMAAQRRNERDVALAAYRRAVDDDPDHQAAAILLQTVLMERGEEALSVRRFEQAREDFDAARALGLRTSRPVLMAVEVRLALDDPRGAMDVLDDSGMTLRGAAPLAFRAATALFADGDRQHALAALQAAFDADPDATKTLCEKDPAWSAYRNETAIRAILAGKGKGNQAGLTTKG